MVKKIIFESFKYRFLTDISKLKYKQIDHNISWQSFIENLNFEGNNNFATIFWNEPSRNSVKIDLRKFIFYGKNSVNKKIETKNRVDSFQEHNAKLIKEIISKIIIKAKYK